MGCTKARTSSQLRLKSPTATLAMKSEVLSSNPSRGNSSSYPPSSPSTCMIGSTVRKYRVGLEEIRYDLVRQDKTRQDKTRQDKTRQDKTRQDKTRQDNIRRITSLH
jgi:hypothetical protein